MTASREQGLVVPVEVPQDPIDPGVRVGHVQLVMDADVDLDALVAESRAQ